ncbi:hypothetical protein NA57DRAFT_70637 [Rhizodiscina lignyota]|uniref:Cytochrome b-c1 complex subunit 8 n=1 Tax=Rhizodiscina lignyota TaxID=1504668 RepID=A0A9P4IUB8_9PEZI|nr:hypothetical protein NA57DRAFT_70637 [Rhizodiscina lignyota]
MGGGGEKMPGQYMGWWGSLGSPAQKGVTTYALSPNRLSPLAGTTNAAIFNVWRRFKNQVLFFAPPLLAGYYLMSWATERNEYLNSKHGRAEFGDEV